MVFAGGFGRWHGVVVGRADGVIILGGLHVRWELRRLRLWSGAWCVSRVERDLWGVFLFLLFADSVGDLTLLESVYVAVEASSDKGLPSTPALTSR